VYDVIYIYINNG